MATQIVTARAGNARDIRDVVIARRDWGSTMTDAMLLVGVGILTLILVMIVQ